MSDVNIAGVEETRRLCGDADVRAYRVDVSSREQVFDHASAVKKDFGGAQFLFNNAGVALAATIEHMTIEEAEWIMGVNLRGVIYGTKAFLPLFKAQREGHIVNLSSVFGLVGFPANGAYNVTKFGVRGFTECLWRELEGSGVYATSVHPGGIKTQIADSARLGRYADDIERGLMGKVSGAFNTTADACARQILSGVAKRRRRLLVGSRAGTLDAVARLFPSSYHGILKALGM